MTPPKPSCGAVGPKTDNLKPLVFLDVDGVLVTLQSLAVRRQRGIEGEIVADRACVFCLNRIIAETGAEIVIRSAWRFSGLREMRASLTLWGVEGVGVDLIPDLTTKRPGGLWEGKERWTEIREWRLAHDRTLDRPFVILDDIADMGPYANLHVCTVESVGLTVELAAQAVGIVQRQINRNGSDPNGAW